MLATLLAMLETEEDRERFLKLHGAYEKKLYAVAVRVLGNPTAAGGGPAGGLGPARPGQLEMRN